MNNVVAISPASETLVNLILGGDLSRLSAEQKTKYYVKVCETVGLNPLTKPFDYMKFQGREILYANKGCAEQLRSIHGISVEDVRAEKIGDLYVVTAKAKEKSGRSDSAIGAVNIAGLKGEALANAMMKAETKAKRRVTLSMCGLGNMPDESEIEDMVAGSMQTKAETLEAKLEVEPVKDLPVQAPDDPGLHLITFGTHANKLVKDLRNDELHGSIAYWREREKKERRKLNGKVLETVLAMEHHALNLERVGDDSPLDEVPF